MNQYTYNHYWCFTWRPWSSIGIHSTAISLSTSSAVTIYSGCVAPTHYQHIAQSLNSWVRLIKSKSVPSMYCLVPSSRCLTHFLQEETNINSWSLFSKTYYQKTFTWNIQSVVPRTGNPQPRTFSPGIASPIIWNPSIPGPSVSKEKIRLR